MTRKEELNQIAQRCMEGEDVDATELYNLFGTRTDMGAMESLAFYIALPLSLDAVAKLEAELMPDASIAIWNYDDHGDARMFWGARLSTKVIKVRATAPSEQLARLAGLCLALAEMENDT